VSHGVIDLHDDLKFVELPATEIGRLKLKKGDLLFVRTNGNPQYIGRCAVFDDERDFLFASYLIRARLKESTELTPNFIQYCLSVPSYRSKIVKETRTTAGNFNINTKGLGALELIVPSRERLGEFEKIQARVKRLLERLQEQAEEADALFNSLSQSVFESQGITKRAV
jgi:type I restriction enzyme S subunit